VAANRLLPKKSIYQKYQDSTKVRFDEEITMKLKSSHSVHLALVLVGGIGLFSVSGCASSSGQATSCNESCSSACANTASKPSDDVTLTHVTPGSPQADQKVFDTPQNAAATLKDAVTAKDRGTLVSLFGDEGKQLVFSGDRVEEENGLTKFAGHLAEYLRVDEVSPTKAVLYVGHENWPFPIPVVKGSTGWFFDTAAGKEELLNRRIGRNELNAIAVAHAYVAAQKQYAAKDRTGENVTQYAQHFMSSEGKKNGLYWIAGDNEEISPMGPLVAQAQAEGYLKDPAAGKHEPYQGYFFHILTAQGADAAGGQMNYIVDGKMTKGFAMIAWPDKWGSSGIMTFIVNQDGKVYQKNLGEKTAEEAKAITEYNPDKSWEEVKE
jgi:hypothetical protein